MCVCVCLYVSVCHFQKSVRVMAKDLVRIRKHQQKFVNLTAQLRALSLQMQVCVCISLSVCVCVCVLLSLLVCVCILLTSVCYICEYGVYVVSGVCLCGLSAVESCGDPSACRCVCVLSLTSLCMPPCLSVCVCVCVCVCVVITQTMASTEQLTRSMVTIVQSMRMLNRQINLPQVNRFPMHINRVAITHTCIQTHTHTHTYIYIHTFHCFRPQLFTITRT